MLLLVSSAAFADTSGFSFVPWSGAAIAIDEEGAAVEASLTTPLFPGPRATWSLTTDASVPTTVLSTSAGGTYSVSAGLTRNNARDLKRAVDQTLFAKTMDALSLDNIASVGPRLSAWCEVFADPKATSWSDDRVRDKVGASSATERAAWTKRIDGFIGKDPSVKRATCATPLSDAELVARLPEIREILQNVEAMERETAFFASDVAATPLNQLALRQVPRRLWQVGPVVSYDWNVDQEALGDPVALSTHGGEAALQGALYFPEGVGVAVAVGATAEWTVDGSEDPSQAGFVELGAVYTTPATLTLPLPAADVVTAGPPGDSGTGLGPAVPPATSTSSPGTPTEATETESAAAEEATPPADNTAVTSAATTTDGGATQAAFYVAIEARGRVQYGTDGDEEMFGLSAALRPTGAGVGLAFGGELTRADGEVAVLPVVSIAGELPDLVTKR